MKADRIKNLALSLGFSHCGIAPANALTQEMQSYFQTVIDQKNYGNMLYLTREIPNRFDPCRWMLHCQSVIVCLYPYLTHKKYEGEYVFAKYAQIKDYHTIIKEKLTNILHILRSEKIINEGKIAVDSSPIAEKWWAVAAGLGVMGKNTLIHNSKGSFFVIGTIFCDTFLEYDSPVNGGKSDCGNCNLCAAACPSQALHTPYQLDACRCFSYLSTTKTTSEELTRKDCRPLTDKRLFGCDICQDVCPKNSCAVANPDAQQHTAHYLALKDQQLYDLDEKAFTQVFNDTALRRMSFEKWLQLIRKTSLS